MICRRRLLFGSIGAACARSRIALAAEPAVKEPPTSQPATPPGTLNKRAVVINQDGNFVQPDYGQWRQVKVGMSEAEVLGILGPPLRGMEPDPKVPRPISPSLMDQLGFVWQYGWLDFSHHAFPTPFCFDIVIQKHKVIVISDPFGDMLSADGKPTVPKPALPADDAVLSFFPRFLDMRWLPSSGVYPMGYEVSIEIGQHNRKNDGALVLEFRKEEDMKVQSPYAVHTFPGNNPGRWRVRATNELGSSEWSGFQKFMFGPKAKTNP